MQRWCSTLHTFSMGATLADHSTRARRCGAYCAYDAQAKLPGPPKPAEYEGAGDWQLAGIARRCRRERTAAAQPPATGRPAPQGAPIVILLQIVMLPHIEAHFPHLKSSAWPACQGQHAPSRGGKPPSAQLPLRATSFLDSPWSQHRGVAMAAISKTRKVRGRPGAHRSPPAGLGVSGRPSGPQCSPVGLCGAASMASPHALARSEPSGAQPLSVLAQGRRSAAGDAATRPAWAACRRRC